MSRGLVLSVLLVAGLSACAHQRPAQFSPVAIRAERITATEHGLQPTSRPELTAFARQALDASQPLSRPARPPACARPDLAAAPPHPPGSAHYLVLSGGSLNGAFGAGFFLGLQDIGRLPPEPDVVTGVSTGSLQSTFLFLGRRNLQDPAVPRNDRDYRWVDGLAAGDLPGLDGRPPPRPGVSDIEDLALAYSIDRERDILRPYPGGGLGVLANGAKGSLGPLRRRLLALISPDTIRAVAAEACRGRKLYVGVTNVNDGYGYALDMTALALSAYDGNATATRMTQVREAYAAGLIASSSVPVGAKPVTLRVRLPADGENEHRRNLFVDGGARFGVFLREIRNAQAVAERSGESDVTLIVNTRLSIDLWNAGEDIRNPKEPWHLTTLGLRTVDILENQVYQLSVGMIEAQAGKLAMAYLSNQNIVENGGPAELPEAHRYLGKTCGEWRAEEAATLHPVQFYPAYMSCLLDYGRRRGQLTQWNSGAPPRE